MKKLLLILLCLPMLGFGQEGLVKGYYESGEVWTKYKYKNNLRNGICKEYYQSGEIEYEANYKDGQLNGVWKRYFKNGAINKEGNYIKDKREGLEKTYDRYGNLRIEENYKNDQKNGLQKEYVDGILKDEVMYKNGVDIGIYNRYFYNEKVKLYEMKSYKNGELMYKKCWDGNGNKINCE